MAVHGRYTDHADHLRAIPGEEERLLPVAALYGANAAGKSNLVRALQVLRNAVWTEQPLPVSTFMAEGGISEIEIQFIVAQRIYIYGLTWERSVVHQEWLLERRANRTISVFERLTAENGEVTVELGPAVVLPSAKLKAMVMIGAQPSQPFLRVVKNNLNPSDRGEQVEACIDWLKQLVLIFPGSRHQLLLSTLARDLNFREFASHFLANIATGITDLQVKEQEISVDELRGMGIEVEEGELIKSGGEVFIDVLGQESTLRLSRGDRLQCHLMTLQAAHVHSDALTHLPLEDESDGTRRLLHLLPALFYMQTSSVIVIDEIDRSLHPQLSKHLIRQFLKLGGQRQLLFTTHDLNLMDLDLLRRDEIWFAEKKEGATELYSLADFKVRKDLSIDKAYLEGRFGAVPPVEQEWPVWVEVIRKELDPRKVVL